VRARNTGVGAVAVILSLSLAAAGDAQVQPHGVPRGEGQGRYPAAQPQAEQPQQPPQPQQRDWQAWDAGVNSRLADPAFGASLDTPRGSLSPGDAEKVSELARQITLFGPTLRAVYILDPDERDTLFSLLDGTSRAVFGEAPDGDFPALNNVISDRLLCEAMAGADAKELCSQMNRLLALKRKLGGNEDLGSFQRAMLQAEFNWLAANLHELPREGRAPEPGKGAPTGGG